MIFREIYSAYYNAVAHIIARLLEGEASDRELAAIVREYAYEESALSIIPSLKEQKWQLVRHDMTTILHHPPSMPMTTIQKRWLKAIMLDPRVRLFCIDISGLEDVEPLFTSDDYCVYDKYSDGDPYDDERYIEIFRTVLRAVKEQKPLRLRLLTRRGNTVGMKIMPRWLEYSEKDDKFRLIGDGGRYGSTVNIARIRSCEICGEEEYIPVGSTPSVKRTVVLRIRDERNALERVMMHFAHLEKQAERISESEYSVRITYDRDDETEMVIRILSFGPMVEVTEPESFRELIIERLKRQKSCGLV